MFFASLSFALSEFLSPEFAYLGFHWSPIWIRLPEAIVLLAGTSILLPSRVTHFGSVSIWIFYLALPISVTVLFVAGISDRPALYFTTWSWLLLALFWKILEPTFTKDGYAGHSEETENTFGGPARYAVYAAVITTFVVLFLSASPSTLPLRGQFGEARELYYSSVGTFTVRLVNWNQLIFLPLLFVSGLKGRNPDLITALLGWFVILLFTGFKKAFLVPVAVGILVLLARRRMSVAVLTCSWAAINLGLVGLSKIGPIFPASIGIRRLLMTPAANTIRYHEVFSRIGPLFFSHTGFSPFGAYSFGLKPARLVAEIYGFSGTNMNVGWIGDAFMNLGWIGVLFYPLGLALMLGLLNLAGRGIAQEYTFVLFSVPLLTLVNSSLNTLFFTQGLAVSVVIALALRRRET